MEERKLIFYSGQGYNYSNKTGKFTVDWGSKESNQSKSFTNISDAITFYESINDEKSFWDYSNNWSELLSSHQFEEIITGDIEIKLKSGSLGWS